MIFTQTKTDNYKKKKKKIDQTIFFSPFKVIWTGDISATQICTIISSNIKN